MSTTWTTCTCNTHTVLLKTHSYQISRFMTKFVKKQHKSMLSNGKSESIIFLKPLLTPENAQLPKLKSLKEVKVHWSCKVKKQVVKNVCKTVEDVFHLSRKLRACLQSATSDEVKIFCLPMWQIFIFGVLNFKVQNRV